MAVLTRTKAQVYRKKCEVKSFTTGRRVQVSRFLVFCVSLSQASLRCFVTFVSTFVRATNLKVSFRAIILLKSFRKLVNS